MTPHPSHRAAARASVLAGLAATICLCACVASAGAARRAVSQYPAGALRPALRVRPGELARAARAKPVLRGNAARALLAYKTMQKHYYVQGTGLYRGEPYSFLWPFSQALAATVSLSHIGGQAPKLARDLHARMYGLQRYLEPSFEPLAPESSTAASAPALPSYSGAVAPPIGPGGASYYDDNEWVGIELARAYALNREAAALKQAEQIMAFVMAGWQTVGPGEKPLPCAGGVPFSNSPTNSSRNTVTTAPAAELALQLYRITGEAQYLGFAQTAYGWVRACLLLPNGLYADHIQSNGAVEAHTWSYNQGSMIGAGALLYQATGDSGYLFQARQTAKAALATFGFERVELENPFFASVYLRNLLYLDSITHDPPGRKLAQAFVDYAWSNLRLSSNLFVSGSPSTATLLGQAAIVQVYALLSTPPASYF